MNKSPVCRKQSKSQRVLPIKLCDVGLFDHLMPHEYESLFLRTKAELDQIKRAYSQLQQSATIDLKIALQFALDPLCRTEISPQNWRAAVHKNEVILFDKRCIYFVHDRPTLQLLKLFSKKILALEWRERLGDQLPDDKVLTTPEVKTRFKIPRSTLQGWEKFGVPSAMLEPLPFEENWLNRHTYIYKDLRPFVDYFNQRKAELNTYS